MDRRLPLWIFALAAFSIAIASCIPKDAAGGSPATAQSLAACPPTAMIEDAEDNNNQVLLQENRSGYVYTFVDKAGSTVSPNTDSGAFTMTQGGAEGSSYAMRMNGKIGTAEVVYAGMGVNFVDPKDTYDASRYGGITFFAKAAPGSTTRVRVKLPDTNTDPQGGVCTECYNDFGYDLDLTTDWQRYTLPFAEMTQDPGWGSPQPGGLEQTKMYGIQFQVNDKGKDYDIWIDNIGFIGCS